MTTEKFGNLSINYTALVNFDALSLTSSNTWVSGSRFCASAQIPERCNFVFHWWASGHAYAQAHARLMT